MSEEYQAARKELDIMRQVLDALEPLDPAGRFRALAAIAARFGFYALAHRALDAAELATRREEPEP